MIDFKKIAKKIIPKFVSKSIKILIKKIKILNGIKAKIIKKNTFGEIIERIVKEHSEEFSLVKVYDILDGGKVIFQIPDLNLMKYDSASIFLNSDFILLKNGAIWEKSHLPQFTKMVPLDSDLLDYTHESIVIEKPKKTINVAIGFSLCGVHSNVWAHFLTQYLPKLYLLPNVLKVSKEKVTVILPFYADEQIREIVYGYLNRFNDIEILELGKNEMVTCRELYHINNTAFICDHSEYISMADIVIPKFVADSLKENLVANIKNIDNKVFDRTNKIYISRRGTRNVLNYIKIEEFFTEKGYKLIEAHNYTLKDKIILFRNASHIVGPGSGGFTNLLFCKKGTKVMMFSNFQRCFDTYMSFFSDNYELDITILTGVDVESSNVHTSYKIPLEKIKEACNKLGF